MANPVRPHPAINEHNGTAPEDHHQQYGYQVQHRVHADVREEAAPASRRDDASRSRPPAPGALPAERYALNQGLVDGFL